MTFCPLTEAAVTEAIRMVSPRSVWDFGNQRYTGRLGFGSTAAFYAANGVEYTAIDVNSRMGAVVGDLNRSLSLSPRDLVVNNGTGEHLFDQCAVFRNAHNLSLKAILHVLPFTPWINHGFYNYNPILFRDLAAANRYETAIHWIGNREAQYISLSQDDGLYVEKEPTFMKKVWEYVPEESGYFNVVLFLRRGLDDFKIPLQGKYVADVESEELRNAYS